MGDKGARVGPTHGMCSDVPLSNAIIAKLGARFKWNHNPEYICVTFSMDLMSVLGLLTRVLGGKSGKGHTPGLLSKAEQAAPAFVFITVCWFENEGKIGKKRGTKTTTFWYCANGATQEKSVGCRFR